MLTLAVGCLQRISNWRQAYSLPRRRGQGATAIVKKWLKGSCCRGRWEHRRALSEEHSGLTVGCSQSLSVATGPGAAAGLSAHACAWVSLPKAPPKPLSLCYLARPERAAQLQEGPDGRHGMAPAGLQFPWWPRCAGAVAEGWLSCRLQQRHERCKLGLAVDHVRAAPRCARRPCSGGLWYGAAGLCPAGAGARHCLSSLETPGHTRHGPCPHGERKHRRLCSLRTTNRVRTRVWREPVPCKSSTTSGSLRLLCLTVAAGLSPSCSFMCVNCNR